MESEKGGRDGVAKRERKGRERRRVDVDGYGRG